METEKKYLLSYFLLFFITIGIIVGTVRGAEQYNRMLYDDGSTTGGGGKSIIKDFFDVFFGGDGNYQINSPSSTAPSNNSNNQNTTNPSGLSTDQLATYPTPQTVNGFKVYRQCNYRNIQVVNGCTKGDSKGGSMCNMGCGITSVAMILTNLLKENIDPIAVWKKYQENKAYIGCDGTNLQDARKVMKSYENRGIKVADTNLFGYSHATAANISEVAPEIRQMVKSGWYVFVLADFCKGGCSHYFVITDIDDNNVVTSYDPYYEPPESSRQPINYTNRYPFPKYRGGFAVRKK